MKNNQIGRLLMHFALDPFSTSNCGFYFLYSIIDVGKLNNHQPLHENKYEASCTFLEHIILI